MLLITNRVYIVMQNSIHFSFLQPKPTTLLNSLLWFLVPSISKTQWHTVAEGSNKKHPRCFGRRDANYICYLFQNAPNKMSKRVSSQIISQQIFHLHVEFSVHHFILQACRRINVSSPRKFLKAY